MTNLGRRGGCLMQLGLLAALLALAGCATGFGMRSAEKCDRVCQDAWLKR